MQNQNQPTLETIYSKRSHAFKHCPLEVPETGIFFSHTENRFSWQSMTIFIGEFSNFKVCTSYSLCWQLKLAFSYSCLTYPPRQQLIASFFGLLYRTILVLHIVIKTQAAWLGFIFYYLCCLTTVTVLYAYL